MDTKELNNLIDRISLTGPGGIDKIKKVLKEVADSSSSDSVEFVIAQALNDLNERIEELKSQVAQRDYIVLKVETISAATITSAGEQLARFILNGVIDDVVLEDSVGRRSRIIAYTPLDADGYFTVVFWDWSLEEIGNPELQYHATE